MKKLLLPAACLMLSFSLVACQPQVNGPTPEKPGTSSEASSSEAPSTKPQNGEKLTDLIGKIVEGAELPPADTIDFDAKNFEDYSFIPWRDGIEAVGSEGSTSSAAHSLVLVRSKEGKAEDLAKEMADKVDAQKWICVQPEVAKVLYTKNYVLMAMTFEKTYNTVKENFQKMVDGETVQELDIKSLSK
ncbi:hypothetical protein [Kallipyga gabonensis]|uniref:hypothetical protein n=1 Tax=Kallipyga gabonensis TaxID=1686287 RepID=UPI0006B5AFBB|nr:hypothetical protein [Kallipyga gabonensis]